MDTLSFESELKQCMTTPWFVQQCCHIIEEHNMKELPTPKHNQIQNNFLSAIFQELFVKTCLKDYDEDEEADEQLFKKEKELLYNTESYKNFMNGQTFDLTPIIRVEFYPNRFWDVMLTQRFNRQIISCFFSDINIAKYHEQKIQQEMHEHQNTLSITARNNNLFGPMLHFLAENVCNCDIYVTIVPTLDNEYPSVYHKIKENIQEEEEYEEYEDMFFRIHNKYVLLVEDFQSMYTSKEQLKEIFEMSDIKVIFLNDLLGRTTQSQGCHDTMIS